MKNWNIELILFCRILIYDLIIKLIFIILIKFKYIIIYYLIYVKISNERFKNQIIIIINFNFFFILDPYNFQK